MEDLRLEDKRFLSAEDGRYRFNKLYPEDLRKIETNKRILKLREDYRRNLDPVYPLVGDEVIFTNPQTGQIMRERISHDHGPDYGVQTSRGGSFYLGDGFVSFSGGLNPAVPTKQLQLVGESEAEFWFFSSDYARADNGVDISAFIRVWKFIGEDPYEYGRYQKRDW